MTETFFAAHRLGDIARHLSDRGHIGQFNPHLSNQTELKFGSNGSLKVTIAGPDMGTWYSHEMKHGGGVLPFLEVFLDLKGKAAFDWLRDEMGIVDNANNPGSKPHNAKSMGRIVATYDYQDVDGKLLFQVVRYADPKDFKQRRPDGNGGWVWSLKGIDKVPYHLPDLGKGGRIYICEGEKDADRLRQWGVVATTSPGGAGKWMGRWNKYFGEAEVVLIPDNDEVGREHAHAIARSMLSQVNLNIRCKIVELSGLPEKGDISDAIDQGLSQGELEDLVDSTEPLTWRDPRLGGSTPPPSNPGSGRRFDKLRLTDIVMRPINWLWPGRIARGKLSLVAGQPGLGKSAIALDIAARVSAGRSWPDGSKTPQGRVLIFSLEDDPEDTIKPRLVAAGANQELIEIVRGVPTESEDGTVFTRSFSIREDVALLGVELAELGDVVAIIIDPISAYLGNDKDGNLPDSHSNADVRAILTPLQEMAAANNVAVIGVTHLRKSSEGDAVVQVAGSGAFIAAARVCLFVMHDHENKERRLVLVAKNNLSEDKTGFAYGLKGHELETGSTVVVDWEAALVLRTADEQLAAHRAAEKRQKDPNRLRLETEFVKLELEFGPLGHNTMVDDAKKAGFTWAKINTVLNELGAVRVLVEHNPDVWGWQLP